MRNSVGDIESEIRSRLKAPVGSAVTAEMLLQAINDGYKDVASRAFCIEHEDTATTVSGSRLVSFNGHRVNFVERSEEIVTGGSSSSFTELAGPAIPQGSQALGYGDGVWVIKCLVSGLLAMYYSTDLVIWTPITGLNTSGGRSIRSITYGSAGFCAVGDPGNQPTLHGYVIWSTDGATWSESTINSYNRCFFAVAYGDGIYCAVGAHYSTLTGIYIATSSGGTWTDRTHSNPLQIELTAVAYGSGTFVAGGGDSSDVLTGYIEYSTDNGVTWTPATINGGAMRKIRGITWCGTAFVAVSGSGRTCRSTDGITWTRVDTPKTSYQLNSVTYNGVDVFAFGNADGTDAYVVKSSDAGLTWAEVTNPRNTTLYSSAFGDNQVVACGSTGADNDVYMISSTLTPTTSTSSNGALLKIRPENLGHISIKDNTPQYWFQWNNNIVIEPVPDDAYPLKLYVSDYPATELTSTTDYPDSLPEEFRTCVLDFSLYAVCLALQRWKQAAGYYNIYIRNLRARRQEYVTRRAEKCAIKQLPNNVVYQGGRPWGH
jgi:hypothetical protein